MKNKANYEIKKFEKEIVAVEEITKGVSIRSQKDLEEAKSILLTITKIKKEVLSKKNSVLRPLLDATKNYRALFAPMEEKINNADQFVRSKILSYNTKLQIESEKKNREIEKKIEKGEITIEQAATKFEKIEQKIEAVPTRKNKVVKIINENIIPDKYWILDMVLIRKEALSGIEIPGTKVEIEETIISRI